jgi:hypothetical protein
VQTAKGETMWEQGDSIDFPHSMLRCWGTHGKILRSLWQQQSEGAQERCGV